MSFRSARACRPLPLLPPLLALFAPALAGIRAIAISFFSFLGFFRQQPTERTKNRSKLRSTMNDDAERSHERPASTRVINDDAKNERRQAGMNSRVESLYSLRPLFIKPHPLRSPPPPADEGVRKGHEKRSSIELEDRQPFLRAGARARREKYKTPSAITGCHGLLNVRPIKPRSSLTRSRPCVSMSRSETRGTREFPRDE